MYLNTEEYIENKKKTIFTFWEFMNDNKDNIIKNMCI
jgi:hypothetical protein